MVEACSNWSLSIFTTSSNVEAECLLRDCHVFVAVFVRICFPSTSIILRRIFSIVACCFFKADSLQLILFIMHVLLKNILSSIHNQIRSMNRTPKHPPITTFHCLLISIPSASNWFADQRERAMNSAIIIRMILMKWNFCVFAKFVFISFLFNDFLFVLSIYSF